MLTVRRNHEKTLVYQERPCSVLSDRYRPWSPEKRRDGYNIGRYARCRLRGTYVHQNGATDSAEYNGSLSRITSTAASAETDHKPKLKVHCLTRLEVATRCVHRALILYEPRAAFYTHKEVKKQKINARIASTVRKNFQLHFRYNATVVKKSWKSGEELS